MERSPSVFRFPSVAIGAAVVAALALVLAAPSGRTQTMTHKIDLAAAMPQQPPPDFDVARTGSGPLPTWLVVEDPTATGGRAIAQTNTDRTDYRFPLAIYRPVSAADVEVTLRFKPVGGKVDQAGGIAIRLTSPDNYYVVRANALEDNVRFYRVVKGRRQEIAGASTKVTSGEWHTLALKAEGNRFAISFDGKQLYIADDKTFAGAGQVALWTKADSVTYFDNIVIKPLS
jgi:hypothetical protein